MTGNLFPIARRRPLGVRLLRSTLVACTLGAGTLVAIAGCGPHRVPSADAPDVPDGVLALEVDNRNWSDVLISVIHDGSRERFIEVGATKSQTFAIPPHLVGTTGMLRLVLHRIGGLDDFITPAVSVRTGNTIDLTIESSLDRSTIGVW